MNQSLKNQRNLKNMFKPAMSGFSLYQLLALLWRMLWIALCLETSTILWQTSFEERIMTINFSTINNFFNNQYIKAKNNLKNWIMAFRGS